MFFSGSKRKLGIDIGTSSIKLVQLRKEAEQYFLETYGIVKVAYQTAAKMEFDVISETAAILKKLLTQSRVTTKRVIASLPNNIVFVSVIEMPAMSAKELRSAIEWEAQRYVPMPLSEVTLSWSALEAERGKPQKVLLTAVPTSVIDNYLKMFKLAGLEPQALEIEALALIRSLVADRKDCLLIVDIGARTTSLNLVDKGFLQVSRNLAIGGETISTAISNSLHVSFNRAEQFKKDLGMTGEAQQIPQTIHPVLDEIKTETSQLIKLYESSGGKVQEIILAGAGAQLPGLPAYFADLLAKVSVGDPLKFISYDPQVRANLLQVSQSLSVALGLGMRE